MKSNDKAKKKKKEVVSNVYGVTEGKRQDVVERGGQPPEGKNFDLHPPPGREFHRTLESVLPCLESMASYASERRDLIGDTIQ